MNGIQEARAAAASSREQLLAQARVSSERVLKRRQEARESKIFQLCRRSYVNRKRMRKAVRGVQALCELGKAPEVQELLKLTESVTLYHRSDTITESVVYLTNNAVVIEACVYNIHSGGARGVVSRGALDPEDSFSAVLDYANTDERILTARLRPIFSDARLAPMPDIGTHEEELGHIEVALRDCQPHELVFQVLVDCANPEKLGRYFTSAVH
jgi:hypothetical protein